MLNERPWFRVASKCSRNCESFSNNFAIPTASSFQFYSNLAFINDVNDSCVVDRPALVPVEFEGQVTLKFPDCEELGPPVLQLDEVAFRYTPDSPFLFENLCIGSDTQSRICIVRYFSASICLHPLLYIVQFRLVTTAPAKRR
jgi:hypothetical protein